MSARNRIIQAANEIAAIEQKYGVKLLPAWRGPDLFITDNDRTCAMSYEDASLLIPVKDVEHVQTTEGTS